MTVWPWLPTSPRRTTLGRHCRGPHLRASSTSLRDSEDRGGEYRDRLRRSAFAPSDEVPETSVSTSLRSTSSSSPMLRGAAPRRGRASVRQIHETREAASSHAPGECLKSGRYPRRRSASVRFAADRCNTASASTEHSAASSFMRRQLDVRVRREQSRLGHHPTAGELIGGDLTLDSTPCIGPRSPSPAILASPRPRRRFRRRSFGVAGRPV